MIKKWREFLLKEDAFNDDKFKEYLFRPSSLKKQPDVNLNGKFTEIKYMLFNMDYHDINLEFIKTFEKTEKKSNDTVFYRIYRIKWSELIENKIEELNKLISNNAEIENLFDDKNNLLFNPLITIEYKNFNRFHWVENYSIPKSLQRIGLGYKTYKKVISICGYISSADDSTREAGKIWGDLLKDSELYSCANIDSYLIFSKEYCTNEKRSDIKKILTIFFSKNTKFLEKKTGIDDEFLEYLQLTKEDEILWKVKEISL